MIALTVRSYHVPSTTSYDCIWQRTLDLGLQHFGVYSLSASFIHSFFPPFIHAFIHSEGVVSEVWAMSVILWIHPDHNGGHSNFQGQFKNELFGVFTIRSSTLSDHHVECQSEPFAQTLGHDWTASGCWSGIQVTWWLETHIHKLDWGW